MLDPDRHRDLERALVATGFALLLIAACGALGRALLLR